jgi:hypothetical protein
MSNMTRAPYKASKPQDPRARLARFVQRHLLDEQHDKEKVRLFRLIALAEGGTKGEGILDCKVEPEATEESIAEELWSHAQDYADTSGSGGSILFRVKGYYGSTELASRGGQHAFRLSGEMQEDEGASLGITSPTGAFALMARLHEGTVRTALLQNTETMRAMSDALRTSYEMTAALQAQMIEANRRTQEAENQRLERELAARRLLLEEQTMAKVMEQVTIILPAIMASRDGGNVAALHPLLSNLLETMDEATFDRLLAAMEKPEQKMAVLMIAKNAAEIRERKAKEQKAAEEEARKLAGGAITATEVKS